MRIMGMITFETERRLHALDGFVRKIGEAAEELPLSRPSFDIGRIVPPSRVERWTASQKAVNETPVCVPSSTMERGLSSATNQWAKGTCPHQALIAPVRAGAQRGGLRSNPRKGTSEL